MKALLNDVSFSPIRDECKGVKLLLKGGTASLKSLNPGAEPDTVEKVFEADETILFEEKVQMTFKVSLTGNAQAFLV